MDVPFPDPATRPLVLPITVFGPAVQTVPLVFASPHSGKDYPPEFVAAARLDPVRLRRSEDSFVDELFASAPSVGAPLLAATFPRAFCDPNREPWELDPAMFEEPLPPWVNTSSPRVGAGLGTIPRVVASGEAIYRGKLRLAEAERRVRECWEPFHATLAELIDGTRARFGACLLIDCHSMPANGGGARQGAEADFVLGDAYGTTCSPAAARRVEQVLTGLGYRVRRNDPYAGGYITRHYGRPRDGVHALQIEINRSLYMDEVRIERSARFPALLAHLSRLVTILSGEAADLIGR
jgi:N-formylglutamate amidohydrolase